MQINPNGSDFLKPWLICFAGRMFYTPEDRLPLTDCQISIRICTKNKYT